MTDGGAAEEGGRGSATPAGRSPRPIPGPQVPLEPAQLAVLDAWQRRIRLAFAGAVGLLVVWAAVLAVGPTHPVMELLALPFAAPLVVVGAMLQLGTRCPRCDARVSARGRLSLPERCPTCRASLRRDPATTA